MLKTLDVPIANATGWKMASILGDMPIDWFLQHPGSNYVSDKSKGKDAHFARVALENMISQQPIDDVVDFWASAGKIGVGRDLTAFLLLDT